MLTARELHALIKTRDFRDFVMDLSQEDNHTSLDVMERMQEINCDSLVLLAYLSMAECLETYPQITSMCPIWRLLIEDNQLTNRFRMEVESQTAEGSRDKGEYGYDNYPPCASQEENGAFSFMVDCCENIHSNVWDKFAHLPLNEQKAYTSVDQIQAEARENSPWFLARLEQWLIQRNTVEAAGKVARRPGL